MTIMTTLITTTTMNNHYDGFYEDLVWRRLSDLLCIYLDHFDLSTTLSQKLSDPSCPPAPCASATPAHTWRICARAFECANVCVSVSVSVSVSMTILRMCVCARI